MPHRIPNASVKNIYVTSMLEGAIHTVSLCPCTCLYLVCVVKCMFPLSTTTVTGIVHDDVIKWKHFPRYWPFVRGIHRSPVNSPHKGQWRGALMFTLICGLNKRSSKQWWGWWFETQSLSLWRHCTVGGSYYIALTAYDFIYPYLIWHKPCLLTEAPGYIQTRFLSTTLRCSL